MDKRKLDITPSPRILQMLGEIDMKLHACVAELIDNSLDSFFDAEREGRPIDKPRIVVTLPKQLGDELIVEDNASGMSFTQLQGALRAGYTSKPRYGSLGLFGMGFNVATARLGTSTKITTALAGEAKAFVTEINSTELQKRESFTIDVNEVPKDPATCGTKIAVKVKPQVFHSMNQLSANSLRKHLGAIYSYLLRKEVPGLKPAYWGSSIKLDLVVDGKPVSPIIPCIWSDQRTVKRKGGDVAVVQYIHQELKDQRYCRDCGVWTDDEHGPCENCGGANLDFRKREIFGWLGIQRYLSTDQYGIDFIRNGRKILRNDKQAFVYEDANSGDVVNEYPIEMPANKGRIVGEIHLNHVPVNYLKNGFETDHPGWAAALRKIRGDSGLQEKHRAKGENNASPLAQLYSAFRRNDPGVSHLIPSEEGASKHSMAAEWGERFHQNEPEYWLDTKWWQSASAFSTPASDQPSNGVGANGNPLDLVFSPVLPGGEKAESPNPGPYPQGRDSESLRDKVERLKLASRALPQISKTFKMDELGTWTVDAFVVPQNLADQANSPTEYLDVSNKVTVLVYESNPVVMEFGRDVRDMVLMTLATLIHAKTDSGSQMAVYQRLLEFLPDEKISDVAVVGQAEDLLKRALERLSTVVKKDPALHWNTLSADSRQKVNLRVFQSDPTHSLGDLGTTEKFVEFLGFGQIAELLQGNPEVLFDGGLFRGGFETFSADQQQAQIRRFCNWLDSLEVGSESRQKRGPIELKILRLQIERVSNLIVAED